MAISSYPVADQITVPFESVLTMSRHVACCEPANRAERLHRARGSAVLASLLQRIANGIARLTIAACAAGTSWIPFSKTKSCKIPS